MRFVNLIFTRHDSIRATEPGMINYLHNPPYLFGYFNSHALRPWPQYISTGFPLLRICCIGLVFETPPQAESLSDASALLRTLMPERVNSYDCAGIQHLISDHRKKNPILECRNIPSHGAATVWTVLFISTPQIFAIEYLRVGLEFMLWLPSASTWLSNQVHPWMGRSTR